MALPQSVGQRGADLQLVFTRILRVSDSFAGTGYRCRGRGIKLPALEIPGAGAREASN